METFRTRLVFVKIFANGAILVNLVFYQISFDFVLRKKGSKTKKRMKEEEI